MDKLYNSKPRTEELKENIHREIANIPAEWLQKLNQNVFGWCEEHLCVDYFVRNVIGKQAH
jgi:hypothetical protein